MPQKPEKKKESRSAGVLGALQRACRAPRTVHLGDQVCQVHGPDQGEVARLGGEEVLLLVICCGRGANVSALCFALSAEGERRMLGTGTYTTLARPFGHRRWWRRTRFSLTWRRQLWWATQSVWEEAGSALAVSREDSCPAALILLCDEDG